MRKRSLELVCQTAGERADKWLAANLPNLSRTQIKRLIDAGDIFLADGGLLKANTQLAPNTKIVVNLPEDTPPTLVAQAIPLNIIFEDADLIVIDKPAGLVVHRGVGHAQNTLVNALLHHFPDIQTLDPERPGIVHRLDKDTSGVMVVARTEFAHQHLQDQFKRRTVKKVYLGLVQGLPQTPAGLIDVPIGRHPQHRQKMAALATGKKARTRFVIKEHFGSYSLLELLLETGRTHQIRVHLSWLGHPIVADALYGKGRDNLPLSRQFLHAHTLELMHPRTAQPLSFKALLPADLAHTLEILRT